MFNFKDLVSKIICNHTRMLSVAARVENHQERDIATFTSLFYNERAKNLIFD